jgi:hypothetical protein
MKQLLSEEIPSDWHRRLLEERLARDKENPEEAIPWEEVREELLRAGVESD